jgi:serine/threonine protein kinase
MEGSSGPLGRSNFWISGRWTLDSGCEGLRASDRSTSFRVSPVLFPVNPLFQILLTTPSMENYEALGVLADALYGDVHKLRHRATGELVAMKRMDLAAAVRQRTKDTNRAIEEDVFAEVQANLAFRRAGGHRHVVSLRDCFADESSVSLVTAFCARGELLEVVNARGALLPVEDALRYFHQIVQGVAFVHAQGIAHRDLSLENVLVDEFDCCKLSDFGMASTSTRLLASGIGKIHYMAPEACCDREHTENYYNPFQADMWSLGVILLTLITGQYPFDRALDSDAHFALLASCGIEALLDQLNFDTDGYDDVVDLLSCLLCVDAESRATAAELLTHECFDEFTAVDLDVMDMDTAELLDADEETKEDKNPVEENDTSSDMDEEPEDDVPVMPLPSGPVRPLCVRRPRTSSMDSTTKPSCTYVRCSGVPRKSAAALKEQRAALLTELTLSGIPAAAARSSHRRYSLKCRKKCALRGVLDGVFRRKKARAPVATAVK